MFASNFVNTRNLALMVPIIKYSAFIVSLLACEYFASHMATYITHNMLQI